MRCSKVHPPPPSFFFFSFFPPHIDELVFTAKVLRVDCPRVRYSSLTGVEIIKEYLHSYFKAFSSLQLTYKH